MAKKAKIKTIATETRVASVFMADGLTAQQAIADAVAHGVHNGRYSLVAEAIQFGARRAPKSKSALYAVWTMLVEHHYNDVGVYDDVTCGQALCAALKAEGLRGDTADATAAKCRAWLAGAVKTENEARKAEKARLLAEKEAAEAQRKAALDAAEALRVADEIEAARVAALRAGSIDSTCVEVVEAPEVVLPAPEVADAPEVVAAPQAEPTKPKRGSAKKDSTKGAEQKAPRKPRTRKTA